MTRRVETGFGDAVGEIVFLFGGDYFLLDLVEEGVGIHFAGEELSGWTGARGRGWDKEEPIGGGEGVMDPHRSILFNNLQRVVPVLALAVILIEPQQ